MSRQLLGDVVTFVRGVTFDGGEAHPTPHTGTVPILRAGNIGQQLLTDADLIWVPAERVSEAQSMRHGDIAICMSSGSPSVVGKTAVLEYPFEGSVGAFCGLVRSGPLVDSQYLAQWLRSDVFFRWRDSQSRGASIQNLRFSELARLEIDLPSLEDQRRTAAKLTSQLAAVETARSAGHDSITTTQGLRVRILDEFLGEQATVIWPKVRLGDLLVRPLRTGVSGPESAEGRMLGLSIAAVRDGRLNLSSTKRVSVDPRTDRLVREGAFYVVRGNGRLNLVGRGGIAPRPTTPVVFPDLLIEAIPNLDLVNADFLALVWDSRPVRGDLEGRSRTATGIYKINLANLSEVLVPLPDIPEQQRIVATLHERLAGGDAISNKLESALAAIEALPAALLRQAFGNSAA